MNPTQLQTTLAPIAAAIAGFLAGRGAFGWDQATWITVITGIGTVAATIWGAVAARKSAMVSTVANMPEVDHVTLDKTVPTTKSLEAVTPENVVAK